MKNRWFSYVSIFVLFLVIGVGGARADFGYASGQPLAPMGQVFTYQGQLKDSAGNPIDGSCDFRFILYDAISAGVQVGPTLDRTNTSVTDGYFIVLLDFGSSAFLGEARWMEVAVKCSGDAGFTTLTPRQALTPAPYALNADLLDGQQATNFSSAGHDHWGQTWTGSGTGLTLSSDTIGLSASGTTYGVSGTSAGNYGFGVYGYASATSGYNYGVVGSSASTSGIGVYGDANATTGATYGVAGVSSSISGNGVYGGALANTGFTYGVYGVSNSIDGTGVSGYAYATSGGTKGVYGKSDSTVGKGVYGEASASSGFSVGVYGRTASTDGWGSAGYASATTGYTKGLMGISESSLGTGVYGYASATSGHTYGIIGMSDSTDGIGVSGVAGATTGVNYGVSGWSASTSGMGVYGFAGANTGFNFGVFGTTTSTSGTGVDGYASATSGYTYGVTGRSDSTDGIGVRGVVSASSGTNYGVYGSSESNSGFGVVGDNNSGGSGVGAWSNTGDLIRTYSGNYPGGTFRFNVDNNGNVWADGTYNTFATSTLDGETHATSSIQSTEVWLEDFGHGTLVNGIAMITIAPDFAGMANLSVDYMVFISLEGDCGGVFVTNKTPTAFVVHELNGGTSNVPFSYRIVAKPAGSETTRLTVVTIPGPGEVGQQPGGSALPPVPPVPAQAPAAGEQVQP
jgi:hypothetical protein